MHWPHESATRLAVFRTTVAFVWLVSGDVRNAARFASLAPELRAAPRGLHWALDVVPVTPSLAYAAYVVVVLAASAALVGNRPRFACAVLAAVGTYLLYIPQLSGTVMHMHHLVWFAALLAASPCGEALAIDSSGRAPAPSSARFAIPIRIAWALFACIYFFPGFWKLAASGTAFVTSDNFRNLVGWKALQSGLEPFVPITDYPGFCRAMAASGVFFELTFALFVFFKRTRVWAVLAALAFHAGTALLLHIHFVPLWLCFTVFVDWDLIAVRLGRYEVFARAMRRLSVATTPLDTDGMRPRRSTWIVGAVLFVGVAATGAFRIVDAWPFACYPTFHDLTPSTMPALIVEVERENGSRIKLPLPRNSREWATSWRLAGLYGDPVSSARIDAYWRQKASRGDLRGAKRVRFYRASIDVHTRKIARSTLLYERAP